jgi:hypothetical protein
MSPSRLYKRVRPAGRVSDKGQIIVGPKLCCRLVDYSSQAERVSKFS